MLVIKTTGLEQYAPGGEARVKVLLIGGPAAGKTRWSSYFPSPIYADCEGGLASVADRRVPYVAINNSQDMADLLNHVKMDGRLPKEKRQYQTVVIDTFDAYQRKLKNEWMEVNKREAFTGWEAWGFLDQKMQLLLTKLLNLDVNVIVNVHYKDKVTKDDDKESHELMLQLSGEIKDTAFNDFDLVGWMGTYWEAVAGERVEKRGITFKRTPDKPFLKDRLHVTPPWLEVIFAPSDYEDLFSRIAARAEGLPPSETLGQIATAQPDGLDTVTTPEQATSGALPAQAPVELPLTQLDKPTLLKKARELGITILKDGSPIKGNTLKSELIAAIEAHQQKLFEQPTTERLVEEAGVIREALNERADRMLVDTQDLHIPAQAGPSGIERVAEGSVDTATGELLQQVAPLGERALELDEEDRREQARQAGVFIHDGPPAVLEAKPPTIEEAVAAVKGTLGGEVIAQEATRAASEALARHTQPTAAKSDAGTCEDCGKDLAHESPDYVKLSRIKYRKSLCQVDYQRRKTPA